MTNLNVVIFSKNRAAQLDVCLRSFIQNCKSDCYNVTIIYTATEEKFEAGYELLQKTSSNNASVKWKRQSFSFKEDVIGSIVSSNPLTMFLVDDIIFTRPFSTQDPEFDRVLNNKEIVALSLRLYGNITHCYATNTPSKVPAFVKGNIWNWTMAEGDWGYPYSVDGNVYRTDHILPILKQLNFKNPNELEAVMNMPSPPGSKPEYMCCYPKASKLINIPANRVQNVYQNRVANSDDPEMLNDRFLTGDTISLDTIKDVWNTTVHIELPYVWTWDNDKKKMCPMCMETLPHPLGSSKCPGPVPCETCGNDMLMHAGVFHCKFCYKHPNTSVVTQT